MTDADVSERRQNWRTVLRTWATTAATTTMHGGWPSFVPAIYASDAFDAFEQRELRFDFIALADRSPLVTAHVKGLFKKYGLQSQRAQPASWAAVRDALAEGDVDCTHMMLGRPIASTLGLLPRMKCQP